MGRGFVDLSKELAAQILIGFSEGDHPRVFSVIDGGIPCDASDVVVEMIPPLAGATSETANIRLWFYSASASDGQQFSPTMRAEQIPDIAHV